MRWLVTLGALGALVVGAGIGISIYRLSSESACPSGDESPVPVLVAERLIPKGTAGSTIARRRLYAPVVIPCVERKSGAIADPEYLLDAVAVVDVFPGQQLTEDEFSSR